MKTNKKKPSLR